VVVLSSFEDEGAHIGTAPMDLDEVHSEVKAACASYIEHAPYMGDVKFKDKDRVKELCKGPGDHGWRMTVYDKDTKLWGSKYLPCVPTLIASGLWMPKGIRREWLGVLSQMAKAKSFFDEDTKRLKQEASVKETQDELEAQRRTALLEKRNNERKLREQNKLSSMVPPTDAEIAAFEHMGFQASCVAFSIKHAETFGPMEGMSPEGRILRWVSIRAREARAAAFRETRAKWLTEDELSPYYHASQLECVRRLNMASDGLTDDFDTNKRPRGSGKRRIHKAQRRQQLTERGVDIGGDVASRGDEATTERPPTNRDDPSTPRRPLDASRGTSAYFAVCSVCQGMICAQFAECICTNGWVPCHECHSFVASHQPCRYDHNVCYLPPTPPGRSKANGVFHAHHDTSDRGDEMPEDPPIPAGEPLSKTAAVHTHKPHKPRVLNKAPLRGQQSVSGTFFSRVACKQ